LRADHVAAMDHDLRALGGAGAHGGGEGIGAVVAVGDDADSHAAMVREDSFAVLKKILLASAVFFAASAAAQDQVSLRLGGKEVPLEPALRAKIAGLARETLARCGPNTRNHADNFGASALTVEKRWKSLEEGGSRLRIAFGEPFKSE